MEQHSNAKEAKFEAKSQLAQAVAKSGKWLAVVWTIGEGGKLAMARTTFDFPFADVTAALEILANDLKRESSGLVTTPLPQADGFGSVGDKAEEVACAINP